MKFKIILIAITLLLTILNTSCLNLKKSNSNKAKLTKGVNLPTLQGYYWVQKIAPGKDAIVFLEKSQRFNEMQLVMVGDEYIELAKSAGTANNVESM
jgi:hypothetical protein